MTDLYNYTPSTDGCDETWDIYRGKDFLISIPFWNESEGTLAFARHIVAALNSHGEDSSAGQPNHPQDLPPDPEGMNDDRASWANAAIETFIARTGTDLQDALADLLADLMHWCDRREFSFEAELKRARFHYDAETGGDQTILASDAHE